MGTRPDVEIVGASFAGLACAQACAVRGLDTAVWERKRDAGEGVRTTGILVKEAAEELDPPIGLTRALHAVRLYGPSLRWVDLEAPGYHFLATDTPELLRTLALRAQDAGADIRRGTSFRPPRRAPILVGADGPRSTVARMSGLGINRRFLSGVEHELTGGAAWRNGFMCSWTPSSHPATSLGWCQGWASRRSGSRGGLIPVGGAVRQFARRDVVLVGDAAGIVPPLTAGGIHTALGSGRAAGLAIASHLHHGGPTPDIALTGTYPTFTWKRMLRRAMDLEPPNPLVDLAFGRSTVP